MDIYLDISPPYMNGVLCLIQTTLALTGPRLSAAECGHRRDFVFNAGFYTDMTPGRRPPVRDQCQQQRNPGRGFPKNPGRMPYTINVEGWYTFEHRFPDSNSGCWPST